MALKAGVFGLYWEAGLPSRAGLTEPFGAKSVPLWRVPWIDIALQFRATG